jgi:hypothetical protein
VHSFALLGKIYPLNAVPLCLVWKISGFLPEQSGAIVLHEIDFRILADSGKDRRLEKRRNRGGCSA